jgi:hypothetical protein
LILAVVNSEGQDAMKLAKRGKHKRSVSAVCLSVSVELTPSHGRHWSPPSSLLSALVTHISKSEKWKYEYVQIRNMEI